MMVVVTNEQRKPVWALTSVSVPLVGLVVGLCVLALPEPQGGHPSGLLRLSQFGGILLLSFFIGHCVAIGALIRGENRRKLAWVGLLLNGIPLFLYLAALIFAYAHR